MFSPTKVVIDAFVDELARSYTDMYGNNERDLHLIVSTGRRSLEIIANSDAPYHDLNHTGFGDSRRSGDPPRQSAARRRDHRVSLGALHHLAAESRHWLCPRHLPR